jgi:hypothetical protein
MSGFIENRAHGASERPGQHDQMLTWNTSAAMLPLVGRIAQDIARNRERLGEVRAERARLEARRHTLAWAERARRYELQEEVVRLEGEINRNVSELDALGVILLDQVRGLVGFPTIVNDRRAFFSWQPGEQGLLFWNFANDLIRRPVPENWTQPTREKSRKRSRPEKK